MFDQIQALTNSSATGGASGAKKTGEDSPEAIQERFMSLLVAQLKNQDPLAPMDNAQVTSQMAQLNTVTGINNLNDTMEAMAQSFNNSQTVNATSMLGRTVMLEGNSLSLLEGQAPGAFELDRTADSVNVNVLSPGGTVVRSIDLGATGKGVHEFNWDGLDDSGGPAPNGKYIFEVAATAAGQELSPTTLSRVEVQGVRNNPLGAMLLTSDGSEVAINDVKQIY